MSILQHADENKMFHQTPRYLAKVFYWAGKTAIGSGLFAHIGRD